MATYVASADMWKATTGGYFPSKEEAEADEQAASSGGMSASDMDLQAADSHGEGFGGGTSNRNISVLGNDTGSSHIDPERATQSNNLFTQGFTDLNNDGYIDEKDKALANTPLATQASPTAGHYQATDRAAGEIAGVNTGASTQVARLNPDGSQTVVADYSAAHPYDARNPGYTVGNTAFPAGTGPGAGGAGTTGGNATDAATDTEDAKNAAQNTIDENDAQNENLFGDVYNRLNNLQGGDYAMSDEARGYQREGLQQQRDLLKRALGFDPNQYATQFADQGLARSVALARSGGTAAQQQAQTFAAMEGAPALYAEGARAAEGIATSRLNTAEAAAKEFGSLGTMTRGQDEQRQQFESNLQVEIGKTFADAVQGKMALNEQESNRMTEVWMNFAQLQSVYDKMSFEEQEAALDRMMQDKQLDQQWKMFKTQLKEEGKIHAKDIVSGFFGLAGGAIGAGGSILAAGAGKK